MDKEINNEIFWFDGFSKVIRHLIGVTILITIVLFVSAISKETGDLGYIGEAIFYAFTGIVIIFILLFIGIVPRFVYKLIKKSRSK